MATHSVNELTSLINTQIDSHEKIHEILLKAKALTYVALDVDFRNYEQSVTNQYLITLYDTIVESMRLHESALDNLIKYIHTEN
ncbi:MAG TPA: hypothetical protein VLI69_07735 [Gammaproteobacteria bacterium]|nr:hypothetical protein [Gammaproteobacteria bacterium]